MAAPSFSSILDRQATSIERPKPFPMGTYLWTVKGQPRLDKSSKKQTPFSEFTLQCTQPSEDVDQEALAEFLNRADGSQKTLAEQSIKATFYHTEDAAWRLVKFLEDCGIDLENKSVSQAQNETPNCQVWGTIRHEPSEDGTTMFARLGDTARVE